jgi:hypothetical protein
MDLHDINEARMGTKNKVNKVEGFVCMFCTKVYKVLMSFLS